MREDGGGPTLHRDQVPPFGYGTPGLPRIPSTFWRVEPNGFARHLLGPDQARPADPAISSHHVHLGQIEREVVTTVVLEPAFHLDTREVVGRHPIGDGYAR